MKLKNILRLFDTMPTFILLAVGIPFIVIGLVEAHKAQVKVESFVPTPGTVIGNDYVSVPDPEDSARVTWSYHAVVRFYTGQGKEYVFTDQVGTYPPKYEIGDPVEILYNPENPRDATIKNWFSLWFGPIWMISVGLLPILGLIGWTSWKYIQAEKILRARREALLR